MKSNVLRRSIAALAIAGLGIPALGEDIDLFTGTGSNAQNPNVVILIDNSANWDSNSQHWTCPTFSPCKQGQSELRAIRRVLDEVTSSLNLGLMMFTPGQGTAPDGAYVRFHVRGMDATNKAAFKELIGQDASCVDGANSLTGSPNCILKNFAAPQEKVGTAHTDYSAAMFEVFKYFGGYTDPAHAHQDVGMTPIDKSHFGTLRYSNNGNAPPDPAYDAAAYSGAGQTSLNPPINADGTNACAKNFLVFIGNGYPVKDSPASLLTGVNGTASPQLPFQTYITTTTTNTVVAGTDSTCETPAQCVASAPTNFPGYDSYTCTGGTPQAPVAALGTDTVCESQSACVSRAQGLAPAGYTATCSGGTSTPQGTATGTDRACETQAACSARAASILPGHTTYSACTGGSAGATQTGADPTTTESRAQCLARARATWPGYTTYTCTGGTSGAATVTPLGNSGLVCETQAACSTRMTAAFPGHDSVVCVAASGSAGPFTLGQDANCENLAQCRNSVVIPAGSNLGSATCSGGTSCGTGGKLQFQNMQASCAGGTILANWTVQATDTPVTNQTMNASGCTQLGNQTFTAFDSCLSNQVMSATGSCFQGMNVNGTKTTQTITPSGTLSSIGNFADEWAKYLYTTDTNSVLGQQNVTTYAIDVFKDQQDANETALLQSMAKYGGGRYFQAKDEDAILNALRQILIEIQSVNSVFASASLPINATNRSQNENQVFIGMFRPDPTALPRWYGNLKHYQIAILSNEAKLADKLGNEAISATTGFVQACAQSFYTSDNGANYWAFSPSSAGTCTSVANSTNNDLPDGGVVEKGAAAEVLRKGNDTSATAPFVVNRSMLTCAPGADTLCGSLVDFNDTNVTMAMTGAASAAENTNIVNFTAGKDIFDDNGDGSLTDPRPSIHGDIAHSRPLPVNFGSSRAVEVFYGSNDGAFHALRGSDGKELWSFIAPEHHTKLKRLMLNTQVISYPNLPSGVTGTPKDYFFDGSLGIYQTFVKDPVTHKEVVPFVADKVWIFPSMRRGGRVLYAFDVSTAGNPVLKWAKGCPNAGNDNGCSTNMDGIGQTWSVPSVMFLKNYVDTTVTPNEPKPVIIVGGGYDLCEDTDNKNTTCTSANKGNHVYVLDADTGALLGNPFDVDGPVAADVSLIDRDFDGNADFAYIVTTRGSIYRIDFSDPTSDPTNLVPNTVGSWPMTKIAYTSGGYRKFEFGTAALSTLNPAQVFLALGSGDRERPLITNYPYVSQVQNKFYMFIDKFPASGSVDLDGSTMTDFSSSTGCDTTLGGDKNGWFMSYPDRGEQTVTSAVIFGGTVFFSTNRAVATPPNSCATNLGEAKGYAVNLLNASGVIGSGGLCGGSRSGTFTGGGLPPSPVVGTVPVVQADGSTKAISILIGGINLDTGTGSPIGAQQPPVPIKQIRSRVYWYPHGDK